MVRNVTAQHFFHVSCALPGEQGGGVNLRDCPLAFSLGRKSFRKQLPAFHPLANIFEQCAEIRIALALTQQIQAGEDGESRLNQGYKLLVEDDELVSPDLLPGTKGRSEHAPVIFHRIDQEALLDKAVPNLFFREAALHLLEHATALVGHFYKEFSHGKLYAGGELLLAKVYHLLGFLLPT